VGRKYNLLEPPPRSVIGEYAGPENKKLVIGEQAGPENKKTRHSRESGNPE
jgi:hypothetical protein